MAECRAFHCTNPGVSNPMRYCEQHWQQKLSRDRIRAAQGRRERAADRFSARLKAERERDPIWGGLSPLASTAPRWTAEEYEQFCREWHRDFRSHLTKNTPSRARERQLHATRVRVLA
jgi:predicted ATPase